MYEFMCAQMETDDETEEHGKPGEENERRDVGVDAQRAGEQQIAAEGIIQQAEEGKAEKDAQIPARAQQPIPDQV